MKGWDWLAVAYISLDPNKPFPRRWKKSFLIAPVTCLLAPRYLPPNRAFALLQRKAGGAQAGQPGNTNTQLDVHSLAQLRSSSVPATDDSPKYAYTLGQHGQYGECLHGKLCCSPSRDCFCCLTSCMHNMYFVVQTRPPCCRTFSLPL